MIPATSRVPRIVAFVAGVTALGVAALILKGFAAYEGSLYIFLVFNLAFLFLMGLVLPRPRLYVYTFFSAFLLLGFWLKVLVQVIWDIGFIEPTGDFHATPDEWDAALLAAACAAFGTACARMVHLFLARRRADYISAGTSDRPPPWFTRFRKPVWIASMVLMAALNVANVHFAFFQIGVNPVVILPLRLNVLAAWLINIGFALWAAALIWWEFRARPDSLGTVLVVPMVEAFFSSVSALSRLIYLLHAGPYWVALYERWRDVGTALRKKTAMKLAVGFFVFFCASILIVFLLRVLDYHGFSRNVPQGTSIAKHYGQFLAYELPNLLVHRWIGLEGVLTVGSVPGRGRELFMAAVTDNPKLGSTSLYQRLAKTPFLSKNPERFTFLANSGIVAIFWYSGSLFVVGFGMMLVAGVLITTELLAERYTANPFLLAVAAAGLASVFSQTTFPYLTMIFLLQLWVAVTFVALLQRLRFEFAPAQ